MSVWLRSSLLAAVAVTLLAPPAASAAPKPVKCKSGEHRAWKRDKRGKVIRRNGKPVMRCVKRRPGDRHPTYPNLVWSCSSGKCGWIARCDDDWGWRPAASRSRGKKQLFDLAARFAKPGGGRIDLAPGDEQPGRRRPFAHELVAGDGHLPSALDGTVNPVASERQQRRGGHEQEPPRGRGGWKLEH